MWHERLAKAMEVVFTLGTIIAYIGEKTSQLWISL
jgi:hypothetical protein